MESPKYQTFCLADQAFFDTPQRLDDHDSRFAANDRPVPAGWRTGPYGVWTVLTPPDVTIGTQGWKIHVSATVDRAAELLDIVWDFCVARRLPFKFLRSTRVMVAVNAKEGARGSSGKLVTIYLPDLAALDEVVPELARRTAGITGPYVLSDLRYGAGPVYLRYGAFTELYCAGEDGEPIPALRGPDGALVPDERPPVFHLPPWVPVPPVLRDALAARSAGSPDDFPYRVTSALQFSNSGGVYLAEDRVSGQPVVLREARPYAGLDRDGRDAVTRLAHEEQILRQLAGLDCVPRVLGRHTVWEHEFLAEEYIEGQTLLAAVIDRHPLVHPAPTRQQLDAYRDWAADVADRVEQAVAAVHARGIRFGDLHPGNVIVRPDGRVALVDFEVAAALEAPGGAGQGAPGFAAPPGFTGTDIDHYALESLRLYLLLPLTQLLARDRAKAPTLLAAARSIFPGARLPDRLLLAGRGGDSPADRAAALFESPYDWPAIRDSLVAGIQASATPERADRLFPGDPNQFVTGGLAVRSGAAGVIYALHRAGAPIPGRYLDWVLAKARRGHRYLRGGFYDGLYGVALVLDAVGRPDEAREILALAGAETEPAGSVGLLNGAAGIGLTHQYFADRYPDSLSAQTVEKITDDLADLLLHSEQPGWRPAAGGTGWRAPTRAGLLRGWTGPALLFLHRYDRTGRTYLLELAATALRRDLAHTSVEADGTRQVLDDETRLAYLDGGSAGLATVLHAYLRYRDDASFTTALAQLRLACHPSYVFLPGLFRGRAGLIAALAQIDHPADEPVLNRHISQLGWHALDWQNHLAFPGHAMQRLSMDLATGSAGVLLALCAAVEHDPTVVPFLDPRQAVSDNPTSAKGGERDVVRT